MFPGPGALLLVGGIGFEAGDKQALAAIGTQPDVNFIKTTGAREHGQQVDEALRKSRVVARAIERFCSIRFQRRQTAVIDKDQIKVRAEAEFNAAETSVTDHGHAGTVAVALVDGSVIGDEIALGNAQHGVEYRFGNGGERSRRMLGIEAFTEEGQADAKQRGQTLLLDHLDVTLEIRIGDGAEATLDLCFDLVTIRRWTLGAIIEQFIQ